MTTANQIRREVMLMAWSLKRAEPTRSFASCLRGAWKMSKQAAKDAARIIGMMRRGMTTLRVSPMTRRQDRRHIGNAEARYQAAYGA